jgi:hypothetical protein
MHFVAPLNQVIVKNVPAKDWNIKVSFPKNTYCLIFLTFFRGDVNLVSSVIVAAED